MNDIESRPPAVPDSDPREGQTSPDLAAPDLVMRRRAAAVLEVLGGARSPSEAAEILDISLPRYYLLEARALEGLIAACEPRPRGRDAGTEGKTFHALKRENDRLRQDLCRTQALARAVQRAAGMPAGEETPPTDGRVRRRRRASARALRAARQLTAAAADPPEPSLSASPLAVESP